MRIGIFGGSGFIGTRLTERLLNAGHEIKIIDISKSKKFPELWSKGDIRDKNSFSKLLKGMDAIYNLAAEHSDNVSPVSRYYEVNVEGAKNICEAAEKNSIKKIIFTSSVAVYGLAPKDTDESGLLNPYNDYGKSKMEAETVYRNWLSKSMSNSLSIIRPTVIFGEDNRGNVYNLFNQIASGRFIMIGNGKNIKSMAYVENVSAFLEYALNFGKGENLFNYVDKPDFDMNCLTKIINNKTGRGSRVGIRLPYFLGILGGLCFDVIAKLSGRKFSISSIRIKKFTQDTMFKSSKLSTIDFTPPVSLSDGIDMTVKYEFLR